MATRYWVGGTGAWSNTARWSDTSGGAGGFSVPVVGDTVYFNGSSGGGTVTLDTATIPAYDATGFTGTFTTSITLLTVDGPTLKLGASATYSGTTRFQLKNTSGTLTLYCQGTIVPGYISITGSVELGENGIFDSLSTQPGGNFTTNNFSITATLASFSDGTCNFGTGTILYTDGSVDISSSTSANTLNVVGVSGNVYVDLNSGTLGSLTYEVVGSQVDIQGPGTITSLTIGDGVGDLRCSRNTVTVPNPTIGTITVLSGFLGGGFALGADVVLNGTIVDSFNAPGPAYLYIVNGRSINGSTGNIIFCNTSALALF